MIYVMSDIHGQKRRFDSVMKQINLQPEDTLYVLGDVIDRNPDGIKILQDAVKSGKKFENPNIEWGMDLQSEHERYLTEEVVKGPMFLINYPKEIKSFYMRENDDGKTVAACDCLVPGEGEIIGGSQREERYEILEKKMEKIGNKEGLEWYLNLRKWGGCIHSGFGIGFERLILFVTGMQNIRDVIPFPRTPKSAEV